LHDRAIADYSEAIKLDPKYAQAYVGKADSYLLLPFYGTISVELVTD
jgi:hypothetical protein